MERNKLSHIYSIIVVLCFFTLLAAGQTPGTVGTITTSSVTDSSLMVSFDPVTNGHSYCVTLIPRHDPNNIVTSCEENTSRMISNLRASTIYDITAVAKSTTGEMGSPSNAVTARTYPSGPVVQTSNPQPNKVLLFMNAPNYASVTEWTIQYREASNTAMNTTVTSVDGTFYTHLLTGLTPNTAYQVRARASKVLGIAASVEQSAFGEWTDFTTGKLSVFGRITLNNVVYNATTHNDVNSDDYKAVLQTLIDAYSSITYVDVTIVPNGIERSSQSSAMGFVLVNYELKITNTTFPNSLTERELILSGGNFLHTALNSNDYITGSVRATVTGSRYEFSFCPSSCAALTHRIERTVTFTEEGGNFTMVSIEQNVGDTQQATVAVILNSNDATGSDASQVFATFDSNSVYGFEYQFLIQDFSDDSGELVYFLKYEGSTDSGVLQPFFFTTGLVSSDLDLSNATYESNNDGTGVSISFPAVDKAITYELIKDSTTLATLPQSDIDASSNVKMSVTGLTAGESNSLVLKVVTRKHDGTMQEISSSPFTVTSNTNDCESCGEGSTCTVFLMSGVQCNCGTGFTKSTDGASCVDINECGDSSLNNCDENAICNNTDGAFTCTCFQNYTGDGFTCTEINIPTNNTDTCENTTPENCTIQVTCSTMVNGVFSCTSNVDNSTSNGDQCFCFSGLISERMICKDVTEFYNGTSVNCDDDAEVTCNCVSCDSCSDCTVKCDPNSAHTHFGASLYYAFAFFLISNFFVHY